MADPQASLEGDTGGDDATAPHTLLEIPPPKKKDKSGGKEGDQMGLFPLGGGRPRRGCRGRGRAVWLATAKTCAASSTWKDGRMGKNISKNGLTPAETRLPRPSCPNTFDPDAKTRPSVARTTEWNPPAATCRTCHRPQHRSQHSHSIDNSTVTAQTTAQSSQHRQQHSHIIDSSTVTAKSRPSLGPASAQTQHSHSIGHGTVTAPRWRDRAPGPRGVLPGPS